MMMTKRIFGVGVVLVSLGLASVAFAGTLQGTAFSYQGQLKQDGFVLNGLVDLEFSLHPDPVAPEQLGTDYRINAVEVVKGLFHVDVDFGAEAFAGADRWLEVRVRTPHDPADVVPFVTLDPRQPVTAAPYALQTRGIVVDDQDEVGIGTTEPDAPLHVLVDTTSALLAEANAGGATAIEGRVFADSGGGAGVLGKVFTPSGKGVEGDARSQTGSPSGVSGIVHSPEGARAVSALSLADTGVSYAVHADTRSPDGYAGYFLGGRNYFEGHVGVGVPSPAADLHVSGNLGMRVDDQAGAPILAANGTTGFVGVGTSTPTGKFNVDTGENLIQGPVTQSDDIVVESADAVLGLYSDDTGLSGSAISLKEIHPQGPLTDHWAMFRATSQAGSSLHFTYGPNADYLGNSDRLVLTPADGTESVVLPSDAVDTREIADEPGIASTQGGQLVVVDSEKTLVEASIDVPTDGFVLAYATVLGFTGTIGVDTSWTLWIADNDTGKEGTHYIDDVTAAALSTASIHEVFSVTAGVHSFSLKARPFSFSLATEAFEQRLTLVFIPTPYGAVDVPQTP
ncbi:MAG: hypothetical protein PVI86_12455 [Phycisphaerae bacterium]|jgi:hypothetical protein